LSVILRKTPGEILDAPGGFQSKQEGGDAALVLPDQRILGGSAP